MTQHKWDSYLNRLRLAEFQNCGDAYGVAYEVELCQEEIACLNKRVTDLEYGYEYQKGRIEVLTELVSLLSAEFLGVKK
jgi:hypothetical protein